MASGSASTRRPFTPSTIVWRTPPSATAITGSPHAFASRGASPNGLEAGGVDHKGCTVQQIDHLGVAHLQANLERHAPRCGQVLHLSPVYPSGDVGNPHEPWARLAEPRHRLDDKASVLLGRQRPHAHDEGLARTPMVHELRGIDAEVAHSG